MALKVLRTIELAALRHGTVVRIAGRVIARQRPETANGFIFLSIEDETGIANAILDSRLYERYRALATYAKFLVVEGTLQNMDKVMHVRARHLEAPQVIGSPHAVARVPAVRPLPWFRTCRQAQVPFGTTNGI